MFSLLMASDDSDWNVNVGENHAASFSLSRLLEYTDATLEQQLKPVTDQTLLFLSGIPALLMSELQTDYAVGNREFVTMRIGRVWNLQIAGKEIHYEFCLDMDLGEVTINDRQRFEAALGLGRWELTRTHWAVKQADLTRSLTDAGLAINALDIGDANAEPLPALAAPIRDQVVVNNVGEYMNYLLSLDVADDEEIFYRGHANSSYRLEPTLFRKNERGEFRYRPKESILVREILTAQANEFTSDKYMLDRLVRMQHYGLPTRLLDVTSNPLIALYFCCASFAENAQEEVDGEVVIITTKSKNVLFFDSDTVSCVANLSLMSERDQSALDTRQDRAKFNNSPACLKLLHFIRREKPYFEGRIEPKDLDEILFVRGRNTNARVTSQSGAFLLFGKDAVLPETGYSNLNIRRVTVRNKRDILAQLATLNIKSSTVFPGIEKAAAEIANKHAFD